MKIATLGLQYGPREKWNGTIGKNSWIYVIPNTENLVDLKFLGRRSPYMFPHIEDLDPEAQHLIVKVRGGDVPGPMFSQKMGMLRVPGKIVGNDVKNITAKEYNGQRIHVLVTVKNRVTKCTLVPTTANYLIAELKEKREPKKKGVEREPAVHNGSLSLDSLFQVVQKVRPRSRSRKLKGTLKEVLGTARSIGCFIMGKHPKDVSEAVDNGRRAFGELFGLGASEIDSLPEFLDE